MQAWQFTHIPNFYKDAQRMAIIRIESVKAEFGHRSHASIYQRLRDGLLTKPVPIGQRAVGWPDYEIKAIARAHIAGRTEEEIRELVNQLHAQRTALDGMATVPVAAMAGGVAQ